MIALIAGRKRNVLIVSVLSPTGVDFTLRVCQVAVLLHVAA
jgi:hypothetical protein